MNWNDIIISVVSIVLTSLATWGVTILISWLNTKIKDKRVREIVNGIIDVVKKQLGGKTIELTKKVNPDLIGGFTVDVDSRVLDASVKNQLEKLRLKLIN